MVTWPVSKSMTFPTPHIGHSRHGLFFTIIDWIFNPMLNLQEHDLPGIRARDLWSRSKHTQPLQLHHLDHN
jgi:hypothetical protein